MNSKTDRLGIDLGGTKIEGILLRADGTIADRRRKPTPAGDYQETLTQVDQLVRELTDDPDLPVGIGTPGSISRVSPMMRNSNSTCLNGKPLLQDFEKQLRRPVRIANDADCFTLSESSDGAAAGASVVLGIILGTGVGGGICVDGKLIAGVNGIAGEWGHNPIPIHPGSDRICFCGRSNCVETWLAGPGLAQTFESSTGQHVSAKEIAELAAEGEASAVATIDDYCEKLASAMAVVINIVDPDTIVVGGGLSNIDTLFEQVPSRLAAYVFSDHIGTRIVKAVHGDSSGVRGAAWLWP